MNEPRMRDAGRPRIAIFSGPSGTIENTAPLVTSNKARAKYGLPLREGQRFDALRPQRLAAPVTVLVEQHSAHPLEADAAELAAEPDGYVDGAGRFHRQRTGSDDRPVYEVELRPEDGLYPLPYFGRQSGGEAWESECAAPRAAPESCRQTFYPDASRLVEEIDRLGVGPDGRSSQLSSMADFDFVRAAPSGGYRSGVAAETRTDIGQGDVAPEDLGVDYFPYRPPHLRRDPPLVNLAELTNRVATTMASGRYVAGLWLESSIGVEETTYWLGLLIDTAAPIVGLCAPESPHGVTGNTGDRNLVDAVSYATSNVWADDDGNDRVGPVIVSGGVLLSARDAVKTDARPGGLVGLGGSGVVGNIARTERPHLTYVPERHSTHRSEVRLSTLPRTVAGVRRSGAEASIATIEVSTRDDGGLIPTALPNVWISKHGRYVAGEETFVHDRIDRALDESPLAGLVAEGETPYGGMDWPIEGALRRASFSGLPVVKVSRGTAEGFVTTDTVPLGIAGGNLSAPKARLLLMACLLRYGALPAAADPATPTPDEVAATKSALAEYQHVFDTH
jgi:hypothetical protein